MTENEIIIDLVLRWTNNPDKDAMISHAEFRGSLENTLNSVMMNEEVKKALESMRV